MAQSPGCVAGIQKFLTICSNHARCFVTVKAAALDKGGRWQEMATGHKDAGAAGFATQACP